MTAFTSADLPSSIDTLEKLNFWSGWVLNHLNPTVTLLEGTDDTNIVTTKVVQSTLYQRPVENSISNWGYIHRISWKIGPDWKSGSSKLWTHVQPISALVIPAEFKQ